MKIILNPNSSKNQNFDKKNFIKIDKQKFGVSSGSIENKLRVFKAYEPIPNVQKEILTVFDSVCPRLEEALALDTSLYYHFIKDQLVSIQLERASYDDLLLFEWARRYFGIAEDIKMNEVLQMIQVEEVDRIVQLFIRILPDTVYQSVLLISRKHDDLFEQMSEKDDAIDWENFEYPEPETSDEEN